MALAGEIVAWLPADFLLPRLWLQSRLLGGDPAVTRARVVNGLSEAELRALLAETPSFLEPFDRYLRITTFQGELSDVGPLFIEARYLLRRALALQDFRWSWYFSGLSRMYPEVEWALLTEDPRIWARALSLVDLPGACQIEDLLGVFGSKPKLRAYYQRLFQQDPRNRWNAAESLVAGYVGALTVRQAKVREESAAQHMSDFDGDIISTPGLRMGAFIRGYVLGRRDFDEPEPANDPILPQYEADYLASGQRPEGSLAYGDVYQIIAWYFRHEFMDPGVIYPISQLGLDAVPNPRVLLARDFARARETLSLCLQNGPVGPVYLTFIQIVCGENFDENWLDAQDLRTKDRLQRWMIAVGHPRLANPAMGVPLEIPLSRQLYSVERLVQFYGDKAPLELKLRLFSQGQGLRYRRIFPEWTYGRSPLEETKAGPLGRGSNISGYPALTTTFLEYAKHYRRQVSGFEWPLLAEQVEGVALALGYRPPREVLKEVARLEKRYREILAQLQ